MQREAALEALVKRLVETLATTADTLSMSTSENETARLAAIDQARTEATLGALALNLPTPFLPDHKDRVRSALLRIGTRLGKVGEKIRERLERTQTR